ncbi:hypothetical protein OAS39_07090, partial [Pirellulales bacterium]|nr:hypothetical protein [Pirellulales bacterium]
SYFVHADTVSEVLTTYSGALTFDQTIVGLIVADDTLDESDSILGYSGTSYPTGYYPRGIADDDPSMGDALTWSGRTVEFSLPLVDAVDHVRIITQGSPSPTPPEITFSIDFQGVTTGAMGYGVPRKDTFYGRQIGSGDILTVGTPDTTPGPNPPSLGPSLPDPGMVLQAAELGLVPGRDGFIEVDALSYGQDLGTNLQFSVDEFAQGLSFASTSPDLRSEGAAGNQEASADVFAYKGRVKPMPMGKKLGNRLYIDGNGVSADGTPQTGLGVLGDVNWPTYDDLADQGDNVDAIDIGTTADDLAGPVYFSLDSDFADPFEQVSPDFLGTVNSGTAVRNGFVGGDVLVVEEPGVTDPRVYASANQLGLDLIDGADSDDLDAIALIDNGDMIFNPEDDQLLFSVRRGSAVISQLDSRLGQPIAPGDILTTPWTGSGSSLPAIYIPAEALGLRTGRGSGMPCDEVCDDLDALDRYSAGSLATVGTVPEPSGLVLCLGTLALTCCRAIHSNRRPTSK